MQWSNTATRFGAIAKLFHWTTAAAFIGAYLVVYVVIWCMDDTSPASLPVLNIHWALGLLVGFLVLPRLLWRACNVTPAPPAASRAEHWLAETAHWLLYACMIVMPLTGYLGTGAPTDFGLFVVPGFNETAAFQWLSSTWQLSWEAFEAPIDVIHHALGKWVVWVIVLGHVAAALHHHWIRRDDVLLRMWPGARSGRATRR
ncbi:cytochrome b [Luteimonas sp. TWI1416]